MRSSIKFAMTVVLALASVMACSKDKSGSVIDGQPWIGEPAPDFSLETLDGKRMSLQDYRGSYLVLHFATSW